MPSRQYGAAEGGGKQAGEGGAGGGWVVQPSKAAVAQAGGEKNQHDGAEHRAEGNQVQRRALRFAKQRVCAQPQIACGGG